MNQKERIAEISNYLNDRQEISVAQACALLDASPATVRRDFNKLAAGREAVKTWGGLVARGLNGTDDSMLPASFRKTLCAEEKKKIAATAASLVKDGDVVIVDGGTTTFFMSQHLANLRIRVVTNSILIAHQIDKKRENRRGAEVFVTGGLIYPEAGLLVGPQAVANIREYHADWAFLSVGGIQAQTATNSNQLVVETERAIIEQSDQVVMLADHSKFGKRSMCRMCGMNELDLLITNAHAAIASDVAAIRAGGVDVREVVV